MKYLNMRVFDLYYQSELVKEVTSFNLKPGVNVKFYVLGSISEKRTHYY